jgi:hypothetical protein
MENVRSSPFPIGGFIEAVATSVIATAVLMFVRSAIVQLAVVNQLARSPDLAVPLDIALGPLLGILSSAAARRKKVTSHVAARILALLVSASAVALVWGAAAPGSPAWVREIETVLLVGLPQLWATRGLGDVFCHGCRSWCERRTIGRVSRDGGASIVRALVEARDWSVLLARPVGATSFCELVVDGCPSCHDTNALSAVSVVTHVPKRGGLTISRTAWVSRLRLAGAELKALEDALHARRAAALAPAPAPGPPPAPGQAVAPAPVAPRPEEVAQRERLRSFAGYIRALGVQRRRQEIAALEEAIPNDEGFVHGPTRAEIVVAALRSAAWAPLLVCPTSVLSAAIESVIGRQPSLQTARGALSLWGTVVAVFFLWQLVQKLGARRLVAVRAEVFGKKGGDARLYVVFIGIYVLIVAVAFAGK